MILLNVIDGFAVVGDQESIRFKARQTRPRGYRIKKWPLTRWRYSPELAESSSDPCNVA
jgi:hypothetical protein